jgi:SAM-dependent methyltransferase
VTAREWYDNDELWVATYPFLFPPATFERAPEEVRQILDLAGCSQGAVLDLCCGPGRHAIPLAKLGFHVTGVDRTGFLLDKAWMRATDVSADVEWVNQDMRRFVRPDSFDLAICMFTSFGYFDDPSDNLTVLENVCTSLKASGTFVLDVSGKEILARIFEATGSTKLEEFGLIVQRRSVTDDWSRMHNEWILINDAHARSFEIDHWIYSGGELKDLLRAAGFAEVRLCGDLTGGPYGPKASRLVAVARKG